MTLETPAQSPSPSGPGARGFPLRAALVLVVGAFLIRLAALGAFGFDRLEFGDARDYQRFAAAICAGSEYPERGNLPFFRAPGFPAFIALTSGCRPETRAGMVKVALALVDSLHVVLIFLVARRFRLSGAASFLVAIVATLHPLFVLQVTDLRSEPLAMAFLTLSLLLLLLGRENPSPWCLLASGASLGIASLVRPPSIVAIIAWTVLAGLDARKRGFRFQALRPAILVTGLVLVVLPWSCRNWFRFGEWILINDTAGYNFWRSTRPELEAILSTRDPLEFDRGAARLEGEITAAAYEEASRAGSTPGARQRWFWRKGLEQIGTEPGRWADLLLRNIADFWRPWLDPVARGAPLAIASGAIIFPTFFFAALGLRRLLWEDRTLAILVIAHFLTITAAHSPFQAIVRYRLPLAEPIILVLATLGGTGALAAVRSRRVREAEGLAASVSRGYS